MTVNKLEPLNSFDDALEELQYRIERIKKFIEEGGQGYEPCLEFYQRLEERINA